MSGDPPHHKKPKKTTQPQSPVTIITPGVAVCDEKFVQSLED